MSQLHCCKHGIEYYRHCEKCNPCKQCEEYEKKLQELIEATKCPAVCQHVEAVKDKVWEVVQYCHIAQDKGADGVSFKKLLEMLEEIIGDK